jgi:hypothetical protein
MVTAEGIFPKVGNDPLYASEVNILAGIGRSYVGTTASFASGTNYTTIGSIVINAGNLPSYPRIDMNYRQTGGASTEQIQFSISGVGGNFDLTIGAADGGYAGLCNYYSLGSNGNITINGHILSIVSRGASVPAYGSVNSTTINTGSELVIFMRGKSTGTGGAIQYNTIVYGAEGV